MPSVSAAPNSEPFCSRIHHERVIRPILNKVAPCCKMNGVSMDSDSLAELVRDISRQIRRPECHVCWSAENKGVFSHRQLGNELWKDKKQNHLEIYYESTCDLACVYCNQGFSTKWQMELQNSKFPTPQYFKTLGGNALKPTPAHLDFILNEIKRLALDTYQNNIASVTLLGGEPLLHTVHKSTLIDEVLKQYYLHARPEAEFWLSLQTNGNTPLKLMEQTIATLNQYKTKYKKLKISIGLSFESIEENYEFVRYGAKWETFRNNIILWSQQDVDFTVQTAINSVALVHLPRFLEFTNEFSKSHRPINLRINPVSYPKSLSLCWLDKSFKKYIDESMSYLTAHPIYFDNPQEVLKSVLELGPLMGTEVTKAITDEAQEMFSYFKAVRQQDLAVVNPELHNYLEMLKGKEPLLVSNLV